MEYHNRYMVPTKYIPLFLTSRQYDSGGTGSSVGGTLTFPVANVGV